MATVMSTPIDNTRELAEQCAAEGNALLAQAERAVVRDDDSAGRMTDLLKVVKVKKAKSEGGRKALVKPLNDHVKWINQQFKDAQAPLTQADTIGRQKLGNYQREVEYQRREEAERLRREEESRRLAEAEAAEQAGDTDKVDQALDEAVHIPDAPRAAPTRGNFGSSSTRKTWKYRLVDVTKVPVQFLQLDDQAIRAEIRGGVRTIPGLEIFEDEQVVIR